MATGFASSMLASVAVSAMDFGFIGKSQWSEVGKRLDSTGENDQVSLSLLLQATNMCRTTDLPQDSA